MMQAVANFMGKSRGGKVSFDPERIVMAGGATGANELLMFCLADPGDAFLIPTPYYPAFDRDLRWRTRVQLLPVVCESSNNFQITKKALEEAYENAQKANIKVKGLIITNPSNPLGTTMDRATLRTLVTFINDKQIHLGRYSVFIQRHSGEHRSKNVELWLGLVPTQHLLASMSVDEEFVNEFLSESTKRLASRRGSFTKGLEQVGIRCLESNGGLFCWMDLRKLLKKPTFEDEMGLWSVIINDVKLNVSPGSSFHCHEPGWFRVCFANMDDKTMEVALRRIRNFVEKGEDAEVIMVKKQNKACQKTLSLSTSQICDENVMMTLSYSSPRVISPHSPIPHSPMVRART
ncbi:hypothetical protein DH2020_025199 [Rehmannia glutinosa]|uniref:Aminotransferase class I/classII large domain-containing protein n=1 Tax=Rehmannia glutinosa TaxID=99300 RepID=A0ABR0W0E4_REHGL